MNIKLMKRLVAIVLFYKYDRNDTNGEGSDAMTKQRHDIVPVDVPPRRVTVILKADATVNS